MARLAEWRSDLAMAPLSSRTARPGRGKRPVGVGLQDLALAGLAWRRITAAEGLA